MASSRMMCWIFLLAFCHSLAYSAITSSPQKDVADQAATAQEAAEVGKSKKDVIDRELYQWWDQYKALYKNLTEDQSKLEEMICNNPDKVETDFGTLAHLVEKTEEAWHLKQEQLAELTRILHHDNFSDTGLATKVGEGCPGLADYLKTTNETARNEKTELDKHIQELMDLRTKIDNHPCACVWGDWAPWSPCSKTCNDGGTRNRHREITIEATNGGTECEGDEYEQELCNQDICCPVDCSWTAWSKWPSCPSQIETCAAVEKTRTRTKIEDTTCPGTPCKGHEFDQMTCNRETELEQELAELKKALDDCRGNSQRPDCEDGKIDVAFLVDSSSSMKKNNKWGSMKIWLDKLVDAYKIDGVNRRAALMKWSSEVHSEETVHFEDGFNAAQMKEKIDGLAAPNGGTLGGKALTEAYEEIFKGSRGDKKVYKVAIFLTDGRSYDDMKKPAQKFHDNEIRLTPVYLGKKQRDSDQLKELTGKNLSYKNHFFQTNDVNEFASTGFSQAVADCKTDIK